MANYPELTLNGLWKNNPAIVQLLGLCPLLAVTGSVVNAIGLGLATILVLACSNTSVSLIRNIVSDAIRLPAFVMIIAAAVTCIELLMQAFAYELYQILGIFLPLITTNCVILGRADGFAAKHRVGPALYDGLIMGFAIAGIAIGAAPTADRLHKSVMRFVPCVHGGPAQGLEDLSPRFTRDSAHGDRCVRRAEGGGSDAGNCFVQCIS